MTVGVAMTITGELVSYSLLNGNKGFQPLAFFLDDGTKTLVMPLKNGTQKEVGGSWVPTFVGMTKKVSPREDDELKIITMRRM